MITFDQFIDTILDNREFEDGYKLQGDVHGASHVIFEWKVDNLSNSEVITLMNFDSADPELATVKTHLNGLSKADTLALEAVLGLGQRGTEGYDKTEIRVRFGLS